jgi:hypothetical protein
MSWRLAQAHLSEGYCPVASHDPVKLDADDWCRVCKVSWYWAGDDVPLVNATAHSGCHAVNLDSAGKPVDVGCFRVHHEIVSFTPEDFDCHEPPIADRVEMLVDRVTLQFCLGKVLNPSAATDFLKFYKADG